MYPRCTHTPHILFPRKGTDLFRWSVIACDQYTSQPEYWAQADRMVEGAPSTLRITLPEVYLEQPDVDERTAAIHQTMQQYLDEGVLCPLPAGMVLTERTCGGAPRRGLVLAFDLEAYDYRPGSQSLIRPTEKTVVERIPPRLKVRQGASIELPHIMILIDDPDCAIIEPLFDQKEQFQLLYDTELMLGGGHIRGWFIPEGTWTERLHTSLAALSDRASFEKKYGCTDEQALLPFAVGDGNHSIATAKAYWKNLKPTLSEQEQRDHPARFVLAEVVNIHEPSLLIEPIHRVMFHVEPSDLLDAAASFFAAEGSTCVCEPRDAAVPTGAHHFPYCSAEQTGQLIVSNPNRALPLATLQAFLDDYLIKHADSRIDYIHGADVVENLGTQPHNIGFLLPDLSKNDLFRGVVFDGVLPRKTFSMGEAHEKRYYMEARAITKG